MRPWLRGLVLLALTVLTPLAAEAFLADTPLGSVAAVAVGGDGTLYLGGSFATVGAQTTGAPLDNTTGTVDRAFPSVNGPIRAVIPDGSGGWYIGGSFTMVGGLPRNRLAQIDSSGAVTGWNPNANDSVYALAISGSTVYVGGAFNGANSINGTLTRNRLAAVDATTGTATSWNPNANDSVNALAISGSTVYVGGSFLTINGSTRNRLAAVDATTGVATNWDPNANSTVYSLAISGSTVYVGGAFNGANSINGTLTRRRLAAVDATTGVGTNWDPNANSTVYSLAISGSTVYVGGDFTTIGSTTRNYLAAVDATTGTATSWNPNAGATVHALAISGSTVYVGGAFNGANSINGTLTRNYLAAVDATTGVATSWNPNAGNRVDALATNGSTVYAGGSFTSLSSQQTATSPSAYLGFLNALPCGAGLPLTTGLGAQWQMLSLPCVPTGSTTVTGLFGDGTGSNLSTSQYNLTPPVPASGQGWVINGYSAGVSPGYAKLVAGDNLSVGSGYWIKSYQAPTSNQLNLLSGTTTPATVTPAQGCASVNGCMAITVTTPSAATNRYNLVGNPFAYNLDWSKVRIRVDGSASTLTPSQANTAGYVSNVINIWSGTTYTSFTDVGPFTNNPNLEYFKAFWVNVLPGAYGHTIEILLPAEQSTYSQQGPVGTETYAANAPPWYLTWLDWMVPPAQAADSQDWQIRLKIDNRVKGWKDHGNLIGQWSDAQAGFDAHDVPKLSPFSAPYLTLMIPHPEWGPKAGDYASDFRPPSTQPQDWPFEVRASPYDMRIFISWEGEAKKLKRMRLIDLQTGKTIMPADRRWVKKGYPVTLRNPVQRYIWRYLGQ